MSHLRHSRHCRHTARFHDRRARGKYSADFHHERFANSKQSHFGPIAPLAAHFQGLA
jgi:hypothetical protein